MKRRVLKVRWDKDTELWSMRDPKSDLEELHPTKAIAVSEAAQALRAAWDGEGEAGQLVVYTKRGTIAFERTYGRDPKRRKG